MNEHSLVPVSLTLHLVVNQDDRASSVLGKNDIQRLLLHRLMVLEAALQRVEELRRIAADRPTQYQPALCPLAPGLAQIEAAEPSSQDLTSRRLAVPRCRCGHREGKAPCSLSRLVLRTEPLNQLHPELSPHRRLIAERAPQA